MSAAGKLPVKVQKRLTLFKMFYPLERKDERQWAKIFKSDFNTISESFRQISLREGYVQEIAEKKFILWKVKRSSVIECMFYFINDAADINAVVNCFKIIQRKKVFLTYLIVRQVKDGENTFDIFRSSKFSYLEHCNRVKYHIKRPVIPNEPE